jgi:hypothetical protein
MSLLLNSIVVTFPRGLGLRETLSAEHAACLGKTPQISTQRFACLAIFFSASEIEKNRQFEWNREVSWLRDQRRLGLKVAKSEVSILHQSRSFELF